MKFPPGLELVPLASAGCETQPQIDGDVMDLDLQTDIAMSAAEVFELAFVEATSIDEAKALVRGNIGDVRRRYPGGHHPRFRHGLGSRPL